MPANCQPAHRTGPQDRDARYDQNCTQGQVISAPYRANLLVAIRRPARSKGAGRSLIFVSQSQKAAILGVLCVSLP